MESPLHSGHVPWHVSEPVELTLVPGEGKMNSSGRALPEMPGLALSIQRSS